MRWYESDARSQKANEIKLNVALVMLLREESQKSLPSNLIEHL